MAFPQSRGPLPFEDIGHYARSAITDRLNFKILVGMLSKLDIDLSVLPDRRLSAGKTSDDVTLCGD